MSNARQLHHEAMLSLKQAEVVSASENPSMVLYKRYLRNALELETKAAMLLKDKVDAEPTRSVLFRSAASIAINCGEYVRAERLVVQALSGNPPEEIKHELLNLFSDASFEPASMSHGEKFIKRAFDLVFSSLVVFFVLSILVPLIAVLIKMESKGPVFFSQLRIGRDNRIFHCFRFRTMAISESDKDKANITKVGAYLRATSLDELPMFLNVLKGDMSVVGPRPQAIRYISSMHVKDIFNARYYAKPGITGLMLMPSLKKELKVSDSKTYAQYVKGWSLLLDIKIMASYIGEIVRGRKSTYLFNDNY